MNDLTEDEIREAVELADGFRLDEMSIVLPSVKIRLFDDPVVGPMRLEKYWIDALAMQLARQARGKWDEWWHDHKSEWAILHRFDVSMNAGDSAGAIRAILKAKVLK